MNLQDFAMKYGSPGLKELSGKCNRSYRYFVNLLYTVNQNDNPPKLPSLLLAKKIEEKTGGEITMQDLTNPTELKSDWDIRPRQTYGEGKAK